jgi:hypothetical protein
MRWINIKAGFFLYINKKKKSIMEKGKNTLKELQKKKKQRKEKRIINC